jgi:hypothetical protein
MGSQMQGVLFLTILLGGPLTIGALRSKATAATETTDTDLQCSNTTCCFLSETESCSLSSVPFHSPILIFPGGNTRCIKSTSTPYGMIHSRLLFLTPLRSLPSLSWIKIPSSLLFSRWWKLLG